MKPASHNEIDIVLLLEGTYPYVSGGVSSWVHQLITALPHYRFGVVFLGSRPEDYGEPKYDLPPHVVHLEHHYVHAGQDQPPVSPRPGEPRIMEFMRRLHDWMRRGEPCAHAKSMVDDMMWLVSCYPRALQAEFLYSETAWSYLTEVYEHHCTDPSFIDFFWTVRAMHEPIWTLGRAVSQCAAGKVYHTVSTGYAGFLGALLHHRTKRPLILSEHGIYTKERTIDLFQATWLRDHRWSFEKGTDHLSYFQHLWIRFFETLGRLCYAAADPIVSLYEANRQRQIQDGADPQRTRVVPNGIPVERFVPLRYQRPPLPPPVLCLIGRVVPVKDVKTFIRAFRTVLNHIPHAEGWIAGPEEEDPEYVTECRHLVENLGMRARMKFLGFQRVDELLPRIGLLVLSSISEALPLVVLEAMAAGVPSVTTDVGACRELVYGEGAEGDEFGAAGAVVPIANPEALAHEALTLLTDGERWRAAQAAGIKRVEARYTARAMIARYAAMYQGAMQTWPESALNFAKS